MGNLDYPSLCASNGRTRVSSRAEIPKGRQFLPQELQSKLHLARGVGLSGDPPKGSIRDIRLRVAETGRIEGIQELGSELNTDSLRALKIFEEGQIEILDAIVADVGQACRHVAKRKRSRLAENTLVKVSIQTLMNRAGLASAGAIVVGTNRGIKQAGGVAGRNGKRCSSLKCCNAIHLPAAEQPIDRTAHVLSKMPPATKR